MKYDTDFDHIEIITVNTEDTAEIPENLVKLSMVVLAAHRANGDLSWLSDMLHETERGTMNDQTDINNFLS